MKLNPIKTWQQRCEENHEGIVSEGMIQARMQEEIDELRQALAQPEPAPVGYVTNSGTAAYLHRGVYLEDDTPLYVAPPKGKWVGLTDEEKEYFKKLGMVGVEIIESKLKQKNEPA